MAQSPDKPSHDPGKVNRLLNELAKIASSEEALLDKLEDVELAVRDILGVANCNIWITERGEAWVARSAESFRVRPDTGPLGKFLTQDDDLFFTDDYLRDPRINQLSPEAQNLRLSLSRSRAFLPGDSLPQAYVRMRSKGATIGVMVISRRSRERWTDDDRWWLTHVAGIVAHIIASDRLLDRVRRSQEREQIHEMLLMLVPILSSSIPFREKMVEIEGILRSGLPVSAARIWLRKGEEGFAATAPDGFKVDRRSGPLGAFMFGEDLFFCTKDYFNDPRIDPKSREAVQYKASFPISGPDQPAQAVPQAYVKIKAGQNTLGVLACAPKPGSELSVNDEWWLTHVANMLALFIENQRLIEQGGGR